MKNANHIVQQKIALMQMHPARVTIKKIGRCPLFFTKKIKYLYEQATFAFRKEGFGKMTLRIWNYILYGEGFLEKTIEKKSDDIIKNPPTGLLNYPYVFYKKYFYLAKIALNEYQINGIEGLIFSTRRYLKRCKGEVPVFYPREKDYEKNLVTIAILTKNRIDLIRPCIESIEKNLSKKYKIEIIIGDTGSDDKTVWNFYGKAGKKYGNIMVKKLRFYFFSKNYNDLIKDASGQYLIFLNNDTVVKNNWIDNLVDSLENKRVGIVGAKLLYKDDKIQHAGIEFNSEGNGVHVFKNEPCDLLEANVQSIVPGVTFACVSMRHDVFDRFKLNEDFREEAQDTDFCFRLKKSGFVILYNPNAEIYHLECSMRNWRKGSNDRRLLKKRWGSEIIKVSNQKKQRQKYNPDYYKDAIIIIRDDGIGDLLMGVSAFNNLRKKYPERKLILLTYERNIEMMNGFGIFDEIIPIPDGMKYPPLPVPTIGTEIYNFISIEMQFGPIFSITNEVNKVPRHVSFASALEVDKEFELLKIPDYSEAKKEVSKLIRDAGLKECNNIVVLNMLASNPARSWWEPYYPKLISAIEEMGFIPIVVGTKNSEYFKGKKTINLIGKTKSIAEYIEIIKLGKYVISTDTSAYHVAALAGIPFLAIFTGGVTPEARLSFYSKYEALEPSKDLACYPCWDEGCKDIAVRWKKDPCRLIIKPERVIEKFKELVKKYPIEC